MTVLDDKLVPRVKEILLKYGLTAVADDYEDRTYDPATGVGASTAVAVNVTITPPFPYTDFYADGDLIQAGDSITFIAALDIPITPKVGMIITLGTEQWRVVDIGKIRTGALIALYSLQLRK